MQKTYSIDFKCKNCKRLNWVTGIPVGTELNDFLEDDNTRCRVCGCLLFIQKKTKEEKKSTEVIEEDEKNK